MEVGFPDDFRCPISLELMSDPVILSSGHTFDRSSIQRWIDSGNRKCPISNLPLPPSPSLIPNHALRSLISSFLNPPTSPNSPSYPPPADALHVAVSYPLDEASLAELLNLAKRGGARRRLLDSAAPSVLLRHVAADSGKKRELCLRILLQLSLDGDDARVGLVAEGAVEPVVNSLAEIGGAAAIAATLLTSLSVVEVNKATIGATPGAIPALVRLLNRGGGRERREAATALCALAAFPENRVREVRAGAIPALIEFAVAGSERASEVLGLLAKSEDGRRAMERIDGFVGILMGIMKKGSLRSTENLIFVMNMVCSENQNMRLLAKKEGMLEICYQLIEEEGGKIAKYALDLVKIIEMLPGSN